VATERVMGGGPFVVGPRDLGRGRGVVDDADLVLLPALGGVVLESLDASAVGRDDQELDGGLGGLWMAL